MISQMHTIYFWYGVSLFLISSIGTTANAQFRMTWLDIGEMHSYYSDAGAHREGETGNRGLEWPAILRSSGHYRAKAYWIGVKDWRDEFGRDWDYRVARIGLRVTGKNHFFPVETRLVARFVDTEVIVDGTTSFDKIALVDEVDPELPADRALYQRYRSMIGLETERWVYAYAHEVHDDYHIIQRRMINTGNTDEDPQVELEGQSLNDVLFYNAYRWVGRTQAGWHGSAGQVWGKFSMLDIVGDGNQTYPVDFTAVYLWYGHDWSLWEGWDPLGSPMLRQLGYEAPGDTIGRLAGMSMQGRVVLHADNSPSDRTFTAPGYDGLGNPIGQPYTLGWIDNDEPLNHNGRAERDYYELGILTRENPAVREGGSRRMYPHYADRVEPTGLFWNQRGDGASGKAGGHSPVIAYGPYQMAYGDTINIVEAEGAAGLSYKAATDIGAAYKASGYDDLVRIPFDANGDGVIDDITWDYDVYGNGSEVQTKNQWFLTSRDSMFQFMYRARDVWEASEGMTEYPMVEPPRPPRRFEVTSHPENIELQWESMADSPDPVRWEIYRTSWYVDNLPYELIASLPGSSRNYTDSELVRGIEYYYFIQAVGPPNAVDPRSITGTPGGLPLRSGRYFTQTYHPAGLLRLPGQQITDFRIVPKSNQPGLGCLRSCYSKR